MPTICNPLSSYRCTKFSDRHHHCLYKKSAPAPLYETNGDCKLQTSKQGKQCYDYALKAVPRLWKMLLQTRIISRVLSRIYCLGEKSRVAEGQELPRGVQRHAS